MTVDRDQSFDEAINRSGAFMEPADVTIFAFRKMSHACTAAEIAVAESELAAESGITL